ncbi:guanine nucleotide-binding protein subunit alpha [Entomophthora muscae]|uniref:Guanine nucleotide-binding protein subunit alpha n=1 Tax=Entomophthora muscae TaxID=34485 RepID=A0ACC2SIN6_9FUNG|nr:guanine nucleotide-binding protein subunit alpha [Entomophthora muscae]
MGCCQSTDQSGVAANESIENQLRADKASMKNEVKLLLLGAGESGKSTIVKQMELIHNGSYSDSAKNGFKEVIFSNTIVSMRVILEAMSELGISLGDDQNQAQVELVFQLPNPLNYSHLPSDVSRALNYCGRILELDIVFLAPVNISLMTQLPTILIQLTAFPSLIIFQLTKMYSGQESSLLESLRLSSMLAS